MSNTSATGGPLAPTSQAPLEDDGLVDFLQAFVVGITGLPGNMVRPRWQPEPPNLPPAETTWAAVGVQNQVGDTYAANEHDGASEGATDVIRHEAFELFCSFYGPEAGAAASRLRDGLSVPQNREPLFLAGMGLVSVGDILTAPELVKNRWISRKDVTVTFRREIRRTYPVLNLLSAGVAITTGNVDSRADVTT